MRLWHQAMIPHLSRQHLLGQHRECCALRGRGWKKKHSTVDYIFKYSPLRLFEYHLLIMNEMKAREYKPTKEWEKIFYRGKNCESWTFIIPDDKISLHQIFPEHNYEYLEECINNLRDKGFDTSRFEILRS